MAILAELGQGDVIFFGIIILASFLLLFCFFLVGMIVQRRATSSSPYTGLPLRHASEIPYQSLKKILRYLYDLHEYDNRIFNIHKAAFCRETGRIFPESVGWFDTLHVDWTFLKKRFPGNYVSWGSLSDIQQVIIQDAHETLNGFQTEYSSQKPAPRAAEPQYTFRKPGPLYVDLDSKVLLGWKVVPGTDFEVLIVQRPKRRR